MNESIEIYDTSNRDYPWRVIIKLPRGDKEFISDTGYSWYDPHTFRENSRINSILKRTLMWAVYHDEIRIQL